jgi:hypothetical protein
MKRLLVFALVATLVNASALFAGESIVTSGARHVQQLAVADESSVNTPATTPAPSGVAVPTQQKTPSYQQEVGTLSKSGMSKSKRLMLYSAIAVGFVASVWVIDHHVLDVTPSSLGTRQD